MENAQKGVPAGGDAEAPYAGDAGRTRKEPVHVPQGGGGVRAVTVYRAVNLATDPGLRDAALGLTLHHVDGTDLLLPYVVHDPAARKLCVVVPEGLRHHALRERAALLARIADDTAHAAPAYVRDAPVVVGAVELASYLAASSTAAGSVDTTGREQLVAQREERLAARGESLTTREDELRTTSEELEAREQDLAMREQDLVSRLDALRLREADVSARESRMVMREAAYEARMKDAAASPPPGSPPRAVPSDADVEEEADAESVEDADDLAPRGGDTGVRTRTGSGRPPPPAKETLGDAVEEIADEEEVAEEIDDLDPVEDITGVGPAPSKDDPIARTDEIALQEAKTVIGQGQPGPRLAAQKPTGPTPSVAPPTGFIADPDREMVAAVVDSGVRLHARIDDAGREQAFTRADLLVQLAVVQGHPVALLALVDGEPETTRPFVRRCALDLRSAGERAIVESLKKRFAARVSLYARDGRFLRTIDVQAPREANAALVLERAARSGGDSQVDGPTACERALAAPPPVREAGHPFVGEATAATSAREATAAVARLTSWAAPEKLDRAVLVLSVPRETVDATFRRILGDAARLGIALPSVLRDRAVSVGVAPEPGELVTRQIAAFRDGAARSDLGPADIAANWEALLAAAADVEVAIDGETHEAAWRAIRAARGDADGSSKSGPGEVDLTKLPGMGPPELVLMLDHPKARRAAALELCKRGDAAYVESVYKAARKMPRAEVVRVVPRVVAFGEAAGDALIDGLSARKTFVRQASALALGQLKLRRAVVPLLHVLESEESDVWREIARVLGELGQSSYRPLLRAAKDGKTERERFAYALAHASVAGSRKALRELAAGADEGERLVSIAQRALVLEDEAKRDASEVRGERPYDGDDPVKRFSRRFYEELAGTAPEADLDAGPDL